MNPTDQNIAAQLPQTPSEQNAVYDQMAIEGFAEDLITERFAATLTDAEHENVKKTLVSELHEHINKTLVDTLSADEQIELENILDVEAPDQVLDVFFEQKIPDLAAKVAAALLEYRAIFLYPVTGIVPENYVAPGQEVSQSTAAPQAA
ncbi:MAG: hypothetical protein WCO78_00905 [Candidatus Roizmanbacteria bacterium]